MSTKKTIPACTRGFSVFVAAVGFHNNRRVRKLGRAEEDGKTGVKTREGTYSLKSMEKRG